MKNKEGFVALVLVLVLSIISLYFINYWQNIGLLRDSVTKKYIYEKQYRATEALCKFGIYFCINNYVLIEKYENSSEIVIFKGRWPAGDIINYDGLLKLKKNGPELLVEALTLESNSTNKITIKTNIHRELVFEQNKPLQKFIITNWSEKSAMILT